MCHETLVSLQEKKSLSFLFSRDYSCQRNGRAVGTHLASPDPRGKATRVFLALMLIFPNELPLLLLSTFYFQLLECLFLLSVELHVVSPQACLLMSSSVMAEA